MAHHDGIIRNSHREPQLYKRWTLNTLKGVKSPMNPKILRAPRALNPKKDGEASAIAQRRPPCAGVRRPQKRTGPFLAFYWVLVKGLNLKLPQEGSIANLIMVT